jgi:hypothetical protein
MIAREQASGEQPRAVPPAGMLYVRRPGWALAHLAMVSLGQTEGMYQLGFIARSA